MAWYERQNPGLGLELKQAVDQILGRIVDAPDRFRRVHGEVHRALLRRFPYAVYYLVEPKAIVVLAVFHFRRDPRRLEDRI